MDTEKKGCCVRAAGWSLVGIVIAGSWGMGNFANGMPVLSAFAIPALIVLGLLGVVVLAVLNVPWFNRLCSCPTSNRNAKDPEVVDSHIHRPAA